jgi:O-antigen/teichoic acid export membrane protein
VWQISRAIYTAAFSRIIRAENAEAARLTERTVRHAVLALVIGCAIFVAGLALPGGVVFGSEYADVWFLMALLTPGVVAFGAAEMLFPYLIVRLNRTRDFIMMTTLGIGANAVLAVALIPLIGLAGAAVSTSVAYVAGAAFVLSRFARLGGSAGPGKWMPGPREISDYRRVGMMLRSRFG